jgi:hypothetical protein
MNRSYDYNGTVVSKSSPTVALRTVRKTLHINSGDRDASAYPTNGEYTVFLPEAYNNIIAIRVKGAEFPPISDFYAHDGVSGTSFANDAKVPLTGLYSIYIDIDGLNNSDETGPCTPGSNITGQTCLSYDPIRKKYCVVAAAGTPQTKNTAVDNTFAKIQLNEDNTKPTFNTSTSSLQNEVYFQPSVSKLDRLTIRLRTHTQNDTGISASGITGRPGFIYSSGGKAGASQLEYGLSLEIETAENSFDDYSTLETRVHQRSSQGYFGNM